jgi:hypothetical protein
MLNNQLLHKFYLVALSAIAFFLPLSVWLLSFFIIVLIIVWIADNGTGKIRELSRSKITILIACSVYFVYLLWMINTSDLSFGVKELKNKLPLLIFPVVIGLSNPLSKKEMKLIISFFIAGVVLSSLTGFFIKMELIMSGSERSREFSIFISHIRLALMANLAIFASVWYFLKDSKQKNRWRYIYLAAAVWLFLFLFILLSLTGIIIITILLCISLFPIVNSSANILVKYFVMTITLVLIISTFIFINNEIRSFYTPGNAYQFPLEKLTTNGNPYQHFADRKDIENGNKVWLYVNENEMKKEWDKRSTIKYDRSDNKGQELRVTLIRYLTSAGLRKDSIGVASLQDKEIKYIENGIANRLYTEKKPIKSKIYEVIWQIDYYRNGGNPSGHSVTQRLEFLKTGWKIFTRNFLFGTGTGDLPYEFDYQYRIDKSVLYPQFRHLAHNQYLTFLISFGITGFLIICISLIVPVFMEKGQKDFLFKIFITIIIISMLGEDTLETHTGVSFFAYFYSLFVFGMGKD